MLKKSHQYKIRRSPGGEQNKKKLTDTHTYLKEAQRQRTPFPFLEIKPVSKLGGKKIRGRGIHRLRVEIVKDANAISRFEIGSRHLEGM